jgi:uncharacterized coiled-coil protein SlyX
MSSEEVLSLRYSVQDLEDRVERLESKVESDIEDVRNEIWYEVSELKRRIDELESKLNMLLERMKHE